jgi:hypothetical protein
MASAAIRNLRMLARSVAWAGACLPSAPACGPAGVPGRRPTLKGPSLCVRPLHRG